MTAATSIPTHPANGNASTIQLAFQVTDPEVVHELAQRVQGPDRDGFARQALRIGVLALRQASGTIDAQCIQREGERMLSSTREVLARHASETSSAVAQILRGYLDPATGSLPQRLERLVRRDGELETLLTKHLEGDGSTVAQTLARRVGEESPLFKLLSPASADGLAVALARTIEAGLLAQRQHLLREFSLDQPDSALSRLVGDIAAANGKLRQDLANEVTAIAHSLSLDNEQGPLNCFVSRVERAQGAILEQFSLDCDGSAMRRLAAALEETRATVRTSLTLDDKSSPLSLLRDEFMAAVAGFGESNAQFQAELRAALATIRVRREEAARSSLHGHTFEYAAGEVLALEAQGAGDLCERLSGTPGREGRKVGDFVLTLGPESAAPGLKIVCECKADKGYSEAKALEELAVARKNRDARFGIFILARECAVDGWAPLRRIGPDILVLWDAADPITDTYLKAAISVAKALLIREHRALDRWDGDMREIEHTVRGIERLVTVVEGIAHDAQLVVKRGTKIGKAAAGLRDRLAEEVERLQGVMSGMIARDDGGSSP